MVSSSLVCAQNERKLLHASRGVASSVRGPRFAMMPPADHLAQSNYAKGGNASGSAPISRFPMSLSEKKKCKSHSGIASGKICRGPLIGTFWLTLRGGSLFRRWKFLLVANIESVISVIIRKYQYSSISHAGERDRSTYPPQSLRLQLTQRLL